MTFRRPQTTPPSKQPYWSHASEVINNIGINPRKYESSIQKGEMERSQQQLSEAMIKAMPYYKWFTTGKSHTRKRNAQLFRQFCEWLGKKPEELRAEYIEARKSVDTLDDWRRETKNTLMQFYNWLKEEKHFKTNYCRTVTTSVMAFYSQNCERILGARAKQTAH